MIELIFLFVCLYLFFDFYMKHFWKFRRGPPGPFQWPIVGNLGNLYLAHSKQPYRALDILAKKYGDVMSIKLGANKAVVLSSFKAMKDLLHKEEFLGRDTNSITKDRSFNKDLGIAWSNSDLWRESRRFTMKGLRELGFGKKNASDDLIREELKHFILKLKTSINSNNGILRIEGNFIQSISNVIWSYIAGYRFSYDDENLKLLNNYTLMMHEILCYKNIYLAFPILKKLFPSLTNFTKHLKMYQDNNSFFKGILEKFRDELYKSKGNGTFDEDKPKNFIESLLRKQEEEENSIDSKNYFTVEKHIVQNVVLKFLDEQIIMILVDLFQAGTETISDTLQFSILYLTLNPQVQTQIYEEILKIDRKGQELSLSDMPMMPYTKASILEILRMSLSVPTPPNRRTTADVHYKGFLIPKDTAILVNYYCNHYDEEFWGDPKTFRPERFLDANFNLVNTERVCPFGFGKRACIGETLSRDTIFLYLTTLVSNFKFECVPGEEKPLMDNPKEGYFTLAPKPFNVLVTYRNEGNLKTTQFLSKA